MNNGRSLHASIVSGDKLFVFGLNHEDPDWDENNPIEVLDLIKQDRWEIISIPVNFCLILPTMCEVSPHKILVISESWFDSFGDVIWLLLDTRDYTHTTESVEGYFSCIANN